MPRKRTPQPSSEAIYSLERLSLVGRIDPRAGGPRLRRLLYYLAQFFGVLFDMFAQRGDLREIAARFDEQFSVARAGFGEHRIVREFSDQLVQRRERALQLFDIGDRFPLWRLAPFFGLGCPRFSPSRLECSTSSAVDLTTNSR